MTTTNVTTSEARAGLVNSIGAKWIGSISYSIPGAGAVWQAGYGTGEPTDAQYGVLNTTQADNFSLMITAWDALIPNAMPEVPDEDLGRIRVAFTDVSARQGANVNGFAYYPPVGAEQPVNGDIWIDESKKGETFTRGDQHFQLLLHEAGHALGLKHSFESPTVPAGYDNTTYTVMSYTSEDNFYSFSGGGGFISVTYNGTTVSTPMVLDIAAIQDYYGADPTTRTGNDVYAFTDTGLNARQAIYDAGGVDTLNLSALSRGSNVDLRPGAYSDIGYYRVADQIDDLSAQFGEGFRPFITNQLSDPNRPAYEWDKNVGIAFSTVIENVTGSKQADSIIGNNAANVIHDGGKGGADTLRGLGGSDTYRIFNTADRIIEASNQGGADKVIAAVSYALGTGVHVEIMQTNSGAGTAAINLTGNEVAQQILGNAGANRLEGKGAADTLTGLGGADTFVFATTLGGGNIDRITDFKPVDDRFLLSDNIFTAFNPGTILPGHLRINATGLAQDASDHIIYRSTDGALFYDGDGIGGASGARFATLTTGLALTNADFVVA